MKIISQGSQDYLFKILRANDHVCCTSGLQFELLLNTPAETPDWLKVELMKWCHTKFYLIDSQKWLVSMLNNDSVFSKIFTIEGFTASLSAQEVPINSGVVKLCFPTDEDLVQETTHARRIKFIVVDINSLTIDKTGFENEGD